MVVERCLTHLSALHLLVATACFARCPICKLDIILVQWCLRQGVVQVLFQWVNACKMLGMVPGTHDVFSLLLVIAVVVMSPFACCNLLPRLQKHLCVCVHRRRRSQASGKVAYFNGRGKGVRGFRLGVGRRKPLTEILMLKS